MSLTYTPYWWLKHKDSEIRHIRKSDVDRGFCGERVKMSQVDGRWMFDDGKVSFKHVCKKCYRLFLRNP